MRTRCLWGAWETTVSPVAVSIRCEQPLCMVRCQVRLRLGEVTEPLYVLIGWAVYLLVLMGTVAAGNKQFRTLPR